MRKNLVLSVVGDESFHRTWLDGGDARSFDLGLIYFGDQPGRHAADAEVYLERKGIKFTLIHELAQRELAAVLGRYDRVWMPDDDIAADTATINRLFEIVEQRRLEIAQPAIRRGDVSFKTLRWNPEYQLRYSRFVEMMCPCFSQAALQRSLPLFNANRSGWGIDWAWSAMHREDQVAVIDAAPVDHMRPLQSGGVHRRLAALGIDPGKEHHDLMTLRGINNRRLHKATVRGTSRLRGIRTDGQIVWTRSLWSSWLSRRAA